MMSQRRRLYLVDAFNLIFRAYHARQRSGAPPMRTSRGTSTEAIYIFHNMLRRIQRQFAPDALAAAFESEGPTLRDQEFEAYKANRAETPPELLEQIPTIARLLDALRVPVVQLTGYEADDVIGTLAARGAAAGYEVSIVSSDKDMLQLVGDGISVLDPMKNDTLYDAAKVKEYKGVPPERIADLLALSGDSVDNIPGAPGIGERGAVQLLEQFGSLDALLERAGEVPRKSYRESLLFFKDQILLSRRLATIHRDAPLTVELDALEVQPPDREALAAIYRELEFFSFLKELEATSPAPDSAPARQTLAIETAEELARFLDPTPSDEPIALAFDPPAPDALGGGAIGLATASTSASAAWPLLHALQSDVGRRNFSLHDYKSLLTAGLLPETAQGIEDLFLHAFLVLADPSACEFTSLCTRYLSHAPPSGAPARAAAIHDIAFRLRPEINADYRRIYETIDLPLAPVLARMERTGIRVDPQVLRGLSESMDARLQALTAAIYEAARHPFNINSPQQLGKVLFEELGLPAQGRTGKTKSYSTAADVLEALAPSHPVVQKVLDYRQVTKLKGTYVDALPALMDSGGRVHTTFNPAGAATGRLSSSNPNLQNIPIRSELGRDIRAAFVPHPGWVLLSADYSQIELRLLAHFSSDAVLVEAFRHNEDIHTRTASEVFGVPPLMVTPEMRRSAKAVNFGIVYGQTAFGLAAQISVSREEAERYIRSYFERYAGVKKWIDHTVAEVRQRGYTLTMHGRRRPIPDIRSSNPNARSFAERTAVNTPLQGTAADLIKLAMIALDADLRAQRMHTRLLLQVHDELVLECPPEELEDASRLVQRRMEGVAHLKVPLLVETGSGPNWRDAK